VFDPLAVLMLIASQYAFKWLRESEEHDVKLGTKIVIKEDKVNTATPDDITKLEQKLKNKLKD
jgi:hypothetical protein